MVRLLGRKSSGNVQKVIWLLEERGIAYQREDYGRQFGNTQDPAYRKLNPTGKVPTLVDGDTVVWESNTILRYLGNAHGDDALYPAEPAARSQVERWMDWQLAALNGPYLDIFRETKKPEAERSPALGKFADALAAELLLLDEALDGREWLVGGGLSLAEICLGPVIHRCLAFPIKLPALDNLRAWHKRYAGRLAFQTAVAETP